MSVIAEERSDEAIRRSWYALRSSGLLPPGLFDPGVARNDARSRVPLRDQPLGGRDLSAVGKNAVCERFRRQTELVGEEALQHAAQVGGRIEVAAFVEPFRP